MKAMLSRFGRAKPSQTVLSLKYRQYASVFVSRQDETAIVVTLHYNGRGGLLFEDECPTVLKGPLEAATVGQETRTALRRTQIRLPVSFANAKPKDWPAFQASKLKTIRQFEQNYIHLSLSGANEANLVYEIQGYPEKDAELKVLTLISSGTSPDRLGEKIIRVYQACRDRQV